MAKINFEDKIDTRPLGVHKEELRANDVNVIKDAINENAEEIERFGIYSYDGYKNLIKFGNGNSSPSDFYKESFFRINPKDSIYVHDQISGGGTGIISLRFPKIPINSFNFDVDVHFSNQAIPLKKGFLKVNISVEKVKVNLGVSVWENIRVSQIYNSSNIKYKFVFADDLEGNLIIGVKEQSTTSTPAGIIILSNLIIEGNGVNDPLYFYKGWEGFLFKNYYGDNNYRIREQVFLKDKNAPISINNASGVSEFTITDNLQFDKYFRFSETKKEVQFKSESFKRVSDRLGPLEHNILGILISDINHSFSKTTNTDLGDVLLVEENFVKRIFNFEILATLKWKNVGVQIFDHPRLLTQQFFLQPIGASFREGGRNSQILLATIEVSDVDLLTVDAYSKIRYNIDSVITKTRYVTPENKRIHEVLVDQKVYGLNGEIKKTNVFSTYVYENKSSKRIVISSDVKFKLVSTLKIDYSNKNNPTPWSLYSVVDNYQVEIIK